MKNFVLFIFVAVLSFSSPQLLQAKKINPKPFEDKVLNFLKDSLKSQKIKFNPTNKTFDSLLNNEFYTDLLSYSITGYNQKELENSFIKKYVVENVPIGIKFSILVTFMTDESSLKESIRNKGLSYPHNIFEDGIKSIKGRSYSKIIPNVTKDGNKGTLFVMLYFWTNE